MPGVKPGAHDKQGELIAVAYLLWDQGRAYYFFSRGMMKPGGNPGKYPVVQRSFAHCL